MEPSCTPHAERGFALIEVIVSAAVLAMVALAVLSGLDGATAASGRERARAVAASLAEQDQERLRALQTDTLSTYTASSRTVTVDGVDYKIASSTRWMKDDSGGTACAGGSSATKDSDYVYITSTVTSSVVGTRISPVTVQSIVTPPVKYTSSTGTLAVQVNNRDDNGVPNLAVAIAGTSTGTISATHLTDATGCALFEHVPDGDYKVTLNRPGWVDKKGITASTVSQTIVAGTFNPLTLVYDQAASATLNAKTYTPGTTTPVTSASIDISTINDTQPMRAFPQPVITTPASAIAATGLFPFKAAYGFWTGSCKSENPETYTAGYFTAAGRAVQADPGGTYVADILQPPLNLLVSHDAAGKTIGSGSTDALTIKAIFIPSSDPGCADSVDLVARTDAAQRGRLSQTQTPGLFNPGIPFGSWNICVWDSTLLKGFRVNGYDNTKLPGRASPLDVAPGTTAYTANVTTTSPTTSVMTSATKTGLGC